MRVYINRKYIKESFQDFLFTIYLRNTAISHLIFAAQRSVFFFADQFWRSCRRRYVPMWSIIFRWLFIVGGRDIIQTANWKPSRAISSQRRSAAPTRLLAAYSFSPIRVSFSLFWTVLESTKSERRIVFTQSAATTDSQTAEGKSSGHCVPVGHIWNSRVGGTRTNSCMPTYSIKGDWNESLLPIGVFHSKLSALCLARRHCRIDIPFTGRDEGAKKNARWILYWINSDLFIGFALRKWNDRGTN